MAKKISTTEITGESVIYDVPVLDETTPLTDDTKMYLDIEKTFRQIPLSRLFNWLKGKMTQVIYPIGSVYMTFDGQADPATMFGGSWAKIEDRFLLGASSGHPVEELGGSNAVTLTIDNLPSHSHSGTTNANTEGTATNNNTAALKTQASSHAHTPSNSSYRFTINKDIAGDNTDVERLRVKTDSSSDRWGMTAKNMGSIYQTNYTSSESHDHYIQAHNHTIPNHTHTFNTASTGGGQAFNTMPEYISVYMWRRTG